MGEICLTCEKWVNLHNCCHDNYDRVNALQEVNVFVYQ